MPFLIHSAQKEHAEVEGQPFGLNLEERMIKPHRRPLANGLDAKVTEHSENTCEYTDPAERQTGQQRRQSTEWEKKYAEVPDRRLLFCPDQTKTRTFDTHSCRFWLIFLVHGVIME